MPSIMPDAPDKPMTTYDKSRDGMTITEVGTPGPLLLRQWATAPENTTCWGLDRVADELERLERELEFERGLSQLRREDAIQFYAERDEALKRLSEASSFSLEQRTAEALDAERYRYLRNVAGQYPGENDGPSVVSGLGDLFEHHFGTEVDDVLDEAMAAWKAAGSPLPKEATK